MECNQQIIEHHDIKVVKVVSQQQIMDNTQYTTSVVNVPSFTLVGIERTISQNDENDPQGGQIASTHIEYLSNGTGAKIPNRLHPQRTYFLYYNYQPEDKWEQFKYKILIGEQVSEVGQLPEGFTAVSVPNHKYSKIECGPGPLFQIKIGAWQWLNQVKSEQLGGERSEDYDFEIYSETHQDQENTRFDLHIGLKQ